MTHADTFKGFTLIELLFTVAIAAILMMVAVPSFDRTIRSNKVSTQTNILLSALQEGRTEAVKRGATITVCRSTDDATCSNTTTGKLLTFIDTASGTEVPVVSGATVLRKQEAMPSTLQQVSDVTFIRFNNLGMAVNLGGTSTIRLEDDECASGEAHARQITITQGGQLSLDTANCADDS